MAPNHRESRETKRKDCSFTATFTFVRRNSIVLVKIQGIGEKPVTVRRHLTLLRLTLFQYYAVWGSLKSDVILVFPKIGRDIGVPQNRARFCFFDTRMQSRGAFDTSTNATYCVYKYVNIIFYFIVIVKAKGRFRDAFWPWLYS